MGITTNLALNKPAMSSSYVLPYDATRAVNGTLAPTSRWLCNKLPGWVCVDLGANYWINRWVVRHMSVAGWLTPDYNMSDFKLQGSNDNRTWYDLDSVTGNTSGITDRTIVSVNVRYVRVYVTKGIRCNTQLASIMEFEVYAAPASQYLSGLTISSGTLSPQPFAGRSTLQYNASVGYDVTNITVTPIAEDAHATIKVNNVVVQSNSVSPAIPLNVGNNTITIQVTSSDGAAQATYTVTVTRAGSQYLQGLTISSGTLSPTPFLGRTTFAYNASVDNSVSNITVTATPEYSGSTVNITCGTQTTQPFALSVGSNTITVVVTDTITGAHQQYTVTVTRAAGGNANLSNLTISSGTLNPGFVSGTTSYTASVEYDISSVTVTPTAQDSSATITVNTLSVTSGTASAPIALSIGNNTITVQVTSGTTVQTYTIIVTRKDRALLQNIVFGSNASFQSAFVNTQPTAGVNVLFDPPDTFTLTPQAVDAGATITINGTTTINSGGTWTAPSPAAGLTNTITLKVSVPGKSDFTYTLTVLRATTPYLAATGGLTVGGYSNARYIETYSQTLYSYTVINRPAATQNIRVTPITADTTPNFMVTVTTAGGFSMTAASGTVFSVPLNAVGTPTIITVTVNSRIGVDHRNYVITVN